MSLFDYIYFIDQYLCTYCLLLSAHTCVDQILTYLCLQNTKDVFSIYFYPQTNVPDLPEWKVEDSDLTHFFEDERDQIENKV